MAYLGVEANQDIVINSHEYVATAGQTEFNVIYDKYVEVYLMGTLLSASDYTATNGVSITLSVPANDGDIVKVHGYQSLRFNELSTKTDLTANDGSTVLPKGPSSTRDASPQDGYIRYNTDLQAYEGYQNGNWLPLGGGATGTGTDDIFYENSQVVTADYSITAGKNAMTAGPITINNGVTVTIPNGSNWVIV